jgi:hypothetical protein
LGLLLVNQLPLPTLGSEVFYEIKVAPSHLLPQTKQKQNPRACLPPVIIGITRVLLLSLMEILLEF